MEPLRGLASSSFAISYTNAMEAVLRALDEVGGDLADDQRRFMAALAEVELDAPNGRVRLDENRQAIAPNYLHRLENNAQGNLVPVDFRVIADVDQTLGGLFDPDDPPPGRDTPRCERGSPPPWASADG